MAGTINLNPDFKEFLQSLNACNVRYLVVGGYAVAFHGHPRYTKDLDVWVLLSTENAANIVDALRHLGFGSPDLKPADFLEPQQVIQLGYPPNRIDLINSLSGVEFDECYRRRVEVAVDGIPVTFINSEDLHANKLSTGRAQDLADATRLKPRT